MPPLVFPNLTRLFKMLYSHCILRDLLSGESLQALSRLPHYELGCAQHQPPRPIKVPQGDPSVPGSPRKGVCVCVCACVRELCISANAYTHPHTHNVRHEPHPTVRHSHFFTGILDLFTLHPKLSLRNSKQALRHLHSADRWAPGRDTHLSPWACGHP